jgi:hypothetical protein
LRPSISRPIALGIIAGIILAGTSPSSPQTPVPDRGSDAPAANLNILIRGQSNAGYFNDLGGAQTLAASVERLLGFDGRSHRVTLLVGAGKTYWSGTGLVPSRTLLPSSVWLTGDAREGWHDNAMHRMFISYLTALPPAVRASPTVTLWLHNESDSSSAGLQQAEWESAIRYSVREERAALRQPARTTPVDFVYVPFDFQTWTLRTSGGSSTVQRLKAGYEHLASDPGLHVQIAAQAGDSDMDGTFQSFGGMHFDRADVTQLAERLAPVIADQFASYALPGSPVARAHGVLPAGGPQGVAAAFLDARHVLVTFSKARAPAGLQALSPSASQGAGWALVDGGKIVYANAATLAQDGLVVSFPEQIPRGGNTRLYYGWGTGRVYVQTPPPLRGHAREAPGRHAAVYDKNGFPIWLPATGLRLSGKRQSPAQQAILSLDRPK